MIRTKLICDGYDGKLARNIDLDEKINNWLKENEDVEGFEVIDIKFSCVERSTKGLIIYKTK